jgi:hypothetical protein
MKNSEQTLEQRNNRCVFKCGVDGGAVKWCVTELSEELRQGGVPAGSPLEIWVLNTDAVRATRG